MALLCNIQPIFNIISLLHPKIYIFLTPFKGLSFIGVSSFLIAIFFLQFKIIYGSQLLYISARKLYFKISLKVIRKTFYSLMNINLLLLLILNTFLFLCNFLKFIHQLE